MILLAVCKYTTNFNEYGLIHFILSSKRLQFITTGLMSGSYAFSKLFVCATLRENKEAPDWQPSYFECETFAPGTHYTFIFEFCLFVVRSILNWVVFAMLWNFDALVSSQRLKASVQLAQQRLLAGAERRGLYAPFLTGVLVLLTWQLTIAVVVSVLAAAYYLPGRAEQQEWWQRVRPDVLGPWLDVLFIAIFMQLTLQRLLTKPHATPKASTLAILLCLVVIPYLWVRLELPEFARPLSRNTLTDLIQSGEWGELSQSIHDGLDVDVDSLRTGYQDLNRLPFTIELFISLLSLFLFIGLRIFQYTARAKDAAALDKLKNLMQTLDTDRDGSVSKLEMRKQYEFYFRPQQPAAATAKGVGSNGESNGGAAAAPAPAKHTQHEMRL